MSLNQVPSWRRDELERAQPGLAAEEARALRQMLGQIGEARRDSAFAAGELHVRRLDRREGRRTRVRTRRPVRRIRWRRLVLVVVAAYTLVTLVQQQFVIRSLHQQINTVQQQITQLQQENAALSNQAQQFKQPAYIEQKARELGFVKPGEVPYTPTAAGGH